MHLNKKYKLKSTSVQTHHSTQQHVITWKWAPCVFHAAYRPECMCNSLSQHSKVGTALHGRPVELGAPTTIGTPSGDAMLCCWGKNHTMFGSWYLRLESEIGIGEPLIQPFERAWHSRTETRSNVARYWPCLREPAYNSEASGPVLLWIISPCTHSFSL